MFGEMNNKFDVLQNFEIKLMESIQNIKIQNKRLNEFEIRVKDLINEKQNIEKLYEKEVERCEQLNEMLIKCKSESKIAIDKEMIELKEKKSFNENQIQRLNNQINELRHELNESQKNCSHFRQLFTQKSNELEKQNIFKSRISSELSQTHNKIDSLNKYLQTIDKNHNQIRDLVKLANDSNLEFKELLKQQNDELIAVRRENSFFKTHLFQLSAKCVKKEDQMNDKHLQSLYFTQQNDLQKKEIIELRQLLEESIEKNQNLMKQLTENNKNICGNQFIIESMAQMSDSEEVTQL